MSLPRLTGDVHGTTVFVALAVLGTEADDLVGSATAEGAEVRWPDGFTVRIRFGPLRVSAGLDDPDQGGKPLSP
ncbi:hypothetical protein ACIA5G_52830 [Amycolatopsis sp. NPDC051758]|uniref:hypothetical protein n=1 Tax=Amycolatopsis sp. NPDC051758 TaxID=3363935 RepID=UPI0037A21613